MSSLTINHKGTVHVSASLMLLFAALAAYKANSFVQWLLHLPTTYATIYSLSRTFLAINIRMRSSTKFRVHHVTGIIQTSYAVASWYKLVWYPAFLTTGDHQDGWFLLLFCWLARLCSIINLATSIPLLAFMPQNVGAQFRRAFVYGILLLASTMLMQYSFTTAWIVSGDQSNFWAKAQHMIICLFGLAFSLLGVLLTLFSFSTVYQKAEFRKTSNTGRSTVQMLIQSFIETDNEKEPHPSITAAVLIAVGIPGCLMCHIIWNLLSHPGCVDVGDHTATVLQYNSVALDFMNVNVVPCMMFDATLVAIGRLSSTVMIYEYFAAQLAIFIGPPLNLYMMASPEVFQDYLQFLSNITAIN